jgi:hypothetical protein
LDSEGVAVLKALALVVKALLWRREVFLRVRDADLNI